MQNYKLNYNRNLVQYIIKIRAKNNKPFNNLMKQVIKNGYKHINVERLEIEVKEYILSIDGNQSDIENVLNELEFN